MSERKKGFAKLSDDDLAMVAGGATVPTGTCKRCGNPIYNTQGVHCKECIVAMAMEGIASQTD